MKIDSINADVNRSSNKIMEANQSKLVFDQLYCFFAELFNRVIGMQKLWGTRIGINRVWQGTAPRVLLFEPETVEVS